VKIASHNQGTVLLTSLLTMTLMSFICATSLYIASQNTNSGMQTASWQQALTGADTGVDEAIAALNTQGWTNWKKVTSSQLPTSQPSGGANTTTAPASGEYNYLISATPLACPVPAASPEGNTVVTWWATVDTAGLQATDDANANQWYRVRATGVSQARPGFGSSPRVSNNRLDNDLRKLSFFRNRQTGSTISALQASRTIEVVVQPVVTQQPIPPSNFWARGITTRNWMSMAGGGNSLIPVVDSFNSSDPTKSTLGLYDPIKRQNHGDLAMVNSTSGGTTADLRGAWVYGDLTYSGPAVQNIDNVHGTKSTPFNKIIPDTADPTWTPTATYTGGSVPPFLAAGTKANPVCIKINGDFTVPTGQTVTINTQSLLNTDPNNNYIEFWVTGKFTVAVGGLISQNLAVHATWYVDGNIIVNGDSYLNLSRHAANLSFIGVGASHTVTESGVLPFWGTINAPGFDVTISGIGGYYGAVIGDTLTLNNLGSIHYDEALRGIVGNVPGNNNFAIDHYAFASWFEDNSDQVRGIRY
jgi:hypothetical protein